MIQLPHKASWLVNGITAHRGNAAEFPENTMAAFDNAIKIGVDWIELDIHQTRDGKLVVAHDANTHRVADVDVTIQKTTYEQLKQVDVAFRFREAHKHSIKKCPPTGPPLLSDVITLIKSQNRTRISIHPRASVVKQAVDIVRQMSAEAWVGFNDTNLEKMKMVKYLYPSFTVFYDRWESDIKEDTRNAKTYNFETVVIHHSNLTPDKVEALHAAGLKAGVWTVDDAEKMFIFLAMGVDRFYTNAPALLFQVKKGTQGVSG